MATKTTDILIIGSGVSALTCAAILGKHGHKVTILEQHYKIGGYLHCFDRFGCQFDTGAHYVGGIDEGAPFWALLNYLGAFDKEIFLPLDRDGFDVFRYPGAEISLPCGHDNAVTQLSSQFPREKAGIEKYFSLIKAAGNSFSTYQFDPDTDPLQAIEFIETPLQSVVESCVSDKLLQTFFYSYCGLHCVAPSDTPFGFHAVMIDSLLRGAYGFRNGGDKLAKILADRIKAQGGEIHTRKKVVALPTKEQKISEVVCADGSRFKADQVIASCHPKQIFEMLNWEHFRPSFKKRVQKITESCSLLGVYAIASCEPKLDTDKNYYAFENSSPESFEALSPKSPTLDSIQPPKSLFIARGRTPHLKNPQDKFPITFHTLGPYPWFSNWQDSRFAKRPPEYKELKKQCCEDVLKFASEHFEGVSNVVKQFDGSTALSNIHYNGSRQGSAYGIYHSIENTGVRALGPRTKIQNLLLTGQNTLFPGILAAAVAGLRTAGQITELKPILSELKKTMQG